MWIHLQIKHLNWIHVGEDSRNRTTDWAVHLKAELCQVRKHWQYCQHWNVSAIPGRKNNTMTEAEVYEHCSQTELTVQMTITSSFVSRYKSGQRRVMFIANGTQNCDGTSYALLSKNFYCVSILNSQTLRRTLNILKKASFCMTWAYALGGAGKIQLMVIKEHYKHSS